MDPDIREALDVLGMLSRDPSARELAEARLDAQITRNTLIEQGRDEGLEEGLRRGREEGRRNRGAELVARQLRLRFGDLSPQYVEQLSQKSETQLDALAERLLTANSLDELFRD